MIPDLRLPINWYRIGAVVHVNCKYILFIKTPCYFTKQFPGPDHKIQSEVLQPNYIPITEARQFIILMGSEDIMHGPWSAQPACS